MSLYNIIDRSEQATVRPAYQLKNYREKHARYSNHLTFLSKCRAQGIIPNGLKVALPVGSARANNIALKTSQALLRERIGNARRQKAVTSARISKLESHLSQSLSAERWTSLEEFCKDSAARTYRSTKEKQIHKFQHLKNQRPATNPQPLDRKKLVVNLSQRPLSTQEEDILSLGLSFAITPRQIPYQEIISATEATAHRQKPSGWQ